MNHTMKIWERIIEARLRDRVEINKQQYGFMPGKETTDVMFALRMLMEKYREDQRELYCIIVDLEKAYDKKRVVVLYEKIKNGGKICATCTEYIRGKQNSGEVCSRNYRKFQGQGRTAPGISFKSVPVSVIMDKLTDEVRRKQCCLLMIL